MNVRADLRKEDLKENQSPTHLSAPDMLSPTVALPSTTGTEKCVSRAPKRIQVANSKVRSSSASVSMFRDFISKKHNFKHLYVSQDTSSVDVYHYKSTELVSLYTLDIRL